MNLDIKQLLELEGWNIDGDIMWIIYGSFKIVVNTKTENVKLYKLNK